MTEEKQKLIEKIHKQLKDKKKGILQHLPVVHEIEDGFAIRFFNKWNYCEDNEKIKYQKIESDMDEEILYHFYLPKGAILDIRRRDYAGCVICLSGHVELFVDGEVIELCANQKKCLKSDLYHGRVLKDTYVVTRANPELA